LTDRIFKIEKKMVIFFVHC